VSWAVENDVSILIVSKTERGRRRTEIGDSNMFY
jgi:hypothetical protein